MPLTLTLTEGILPKGAGKEAFAELAASMLKLHGLEENAFMKPNLVG